MKKSDLKLVVIGGGTGSFTLLQTFKRSFDSITALVNMADNGGSSGMLRDELGVLPPGDIRQCLVALSATPELRDLFNYRFDNGTLKGHTLGNIFLSALEKTTGNFSEAVKSASKILRITGQVIPITTVDTHLVMLDGEKKIITGQFLIENTDMSPETRPELSLEPNAEINPEAKEALLSADVIIIAPGNLYTSLAPALLVRGVEEALKASKAKKIYICNLVTKPKQTDDYSVDDYAGEIERFIGSPVLDYVFYNSEEPAADLLTRYTHDGEYLVKYRPESVPERHYKVIGLPLIAKEEVHIKDGDPMALNRSLIRHDPNLLVPEIIAIYENRY
jgi:uncharacterized cofD-like protein